jgi:pimeloyl-ACP methyl ester carboxylesterase
MATLTPEAQEIFGTTYDDPDHLWLHVHFTHSQDSQAAGREFLRRFRRRADNRDPEVKGKVAPDQIEAIGKWGVPQEKPFEYLNSIRQPTLVVNGGKDVIIYSMNSFMLGSVWPCEAALHAAHCADFPARKSGAFETGGRRVGISNSE